MSSFLSIVQNLEICTISRALKILLILRFQALLFLRSRVTFCTDVLLRAPGAARRDSRTSSSHRFNLCPKEKPSVSPPKLSSFLDHRSRYLSPIQIENADQA